MLVTGFRSRGMRVATDRGWAHRGRIWERRRLKVLAGVGDEWVCWRGGVGVNDGDGAAVWDFIAVAWRWR